MVVTPMDGNDLHRFPLNRLPGQDGSALHSPHEFHARNGMGIVTTDDKQPTEFGWYLLAAMTEAGFRRHAQLARASGISGSTLSRLIYGGVDRPDEGTLERIAQALSLQPEDVKARAGYTVARNARRYHRRALEVDALLGEGTPLPPDDQEYIDTMIGKLIAPYLEQVFRRTA